MHKSLPVYTGSKLVIKLIKKIFGSKIVFLIVLVAVLAGGQSDGKSSPYNDASRDAIGVCPPFNLLDAKGNIIDPINCINADVPYSPKQTCGKCHDYDKITGGYHFQQGKGETLPPEFKKRYPWTTSPAQYGGRW